MSAPSCWTEQRTVWEIEYVDTVTQKCMPVTKQECRPVIKQRCMSVTKQECRPVTKQECMPVTKQECMPVTKQECMPVTKVTRKSKILECQVFFKLSSPSPQS